MNLSGRYWSRYSPYAATVQDALESMATRADLRSPEKDTTRAPCNIAMRPMCVTWPVLATDGPMPPGAYGAAACMRCLKNLL